MEEGPRAFRTMDDQSLGGEGWGSRSRRACPTTCRVLSGGQDSKKRRRRGKGQAKQVQEKKKEPEEEEQRDEEQNAKDEGETSKEGRGALQGYGDGHAFGSEKEILAEGKEEDKEERKKEGLLVREPELQQELSRQWRRSSIQWNAETEAVQRRHGHPGGCRELSRNVDNILGYIVPGPSPAEQGGGGDVARWSLASSSKEVRPDDPVPSDEPSYAAGGAHVEHSAGLLGQSPTFGGLRLDSSKAEEFGGDGRRSAFFSGYSHGTSGRREDDGGLHSRGSRGCQESQRDGEDLQPSEQTYGKSLGESWRRKGKPKGEQRRWEERKRQRWKGKARRKEGRMSPLLESPKLEGDKAICQAVRDSDFRHKQTGKEVETRVVSESVGGATDPQMQRELPRGDSCWPGLVSPSELAEGCSSLEKHSSSTLGELGSFLSKCFDDVMRCKSPYLAKGEDVVPQTSSPSACISSGSCPYEGWLSATCRALRDLADEPHGKKEGWQLESVRNQLRRFDVWDVKGPVINFEEFFTSKSVDYGGEEVRLAQKVNWEAVRNSLPSAVGGLPVEEFCSLGTLHYIRNFEDYLIPPKDQIFTKPPKVLVEDGQWHAVCKGLLEKGVCEVMAVTSLHHVGNEPLLNGLFAVGKGEYIGSLETQRLIMNLVPTNRICRAIKGDVGTLPAVAGMGGVLPEGEEPPPISSEDTKRPPHPPKIPDPRKRYMGFNKLVPEDLVPGSLRGQDCVLVSSVLPMGFCNSVAIAQHIHRGVVSKVMREGSHVFPCQSELRRDKPLPTSTALHRVYLDNFDALE